MASLLCRRNRTVPNCLNYKVSKITVITLAKLAWLNKFGWLKKMVAYEPALLKPHTVIVV